MKAAVLQKIQQFSKFLLTTTALAYFFALLEKFTPFIRVAYLDSWVLLVLVTSLVVWHVSSLILLRRRLLVKHQSANLLQLIPKLIKISFARLVAHLLKVKHQVQSIGKDIRKSTVQTVQRLFKKIRASKLVVGLSSVAKKIVVIKKSAVFLRSALRSLARFGLQFWNSQDAKKGLLAGVLLIISLGATVAYDIKVLGNPFSVLSITHSAQEVLTTPQTTLQQAGDTIRGQFKASKDGLGIVAVKFDTGGESIRGQVVFRIKEQGAEEWYYENSYKTNQFQDGEYFPFGFAEVAESNNKT